MQITARQSLQYSIDIWNWKSYNPTKDTMEYQGFKDHSPCPLCRYVNTKYKREADCKYCPMYSFWPTATGYADKCSMKLGTTAYSQAIDHDNLDYDRSFFALILVEAFEQRLEWILDHHDDIFNYGG